MSPVELLPLLFAVEEVMVVLDAVEKTNEIETSTPSGMESGGMTVRKNLTVAPVKDSDESSLLFTSSQSLSSNPGRCHPTRSA